MKRSQFTEGQIIGILKEQEAGASTGDLCRGHLPGGCDTLSRGLCTVVSPVRNEPRQ